MSAKGKNKREFELDKSELDCSGWISLFPLCPAGLSNFQDPQQGNVLCGCCQRFSIWMFLLH